MSWREYGLAQKNGRSEVSRSFKIWNYTVAMDGPLKTPLTWPLPHVPKLPWAALQQPDIVGEKSAVVWLAEWKFGKTRPDKDGPNNTNNTYCPSGLWALPWAEGPRHRLDPSECTWANEQRKTIRVAAKLSEVSFQRQSTEGISWTSAKPRMEACSAVYPSVLPLRRHLFLQGVTHFDLEWREHMSNKPLNLRCVGPQCSRPKRITT